MRILVAIFGVVIILLVAQDAFETIVLPRRVTRPIRLTQIFYKVVQVEWSIVGRLIRKSARREDYLGAFGPLSLLGLIAFWAVLFVCGFGLLFWGLALPIKAPGQEIHFITYLYLSGTTFFTLGLGDVTPQLGIGHTLIVIEVALGFIFLALVISYVPIIYQAFSRRELRISLLDARAGSPPTAVELLRRNCASKNVQELQLLLHDWEVWCADILESHLSYPILAYYRSQHEQQSWVEALTVILDTCALILAGTEGIPTEPTRFTFAMARHAIVDLAQVLDSPPDLKTDRLSSADFAKLRDLLLSYGIHFKDDAIAEQNLVELRETYEPFVGSLATRMFATLPPWLPPGDTLDDWQTSAWDNMFPSAHRTLLKVMHRKEVANPMRMKLP